MATATKPTYRATFILDTRGVEGSVDSLFEQITTVLEGLGASVTKVENHGTCEFTRTSQNTGLNSGVYVQYYFEGPTIVPSALKEKFRLDNRVDRIIVERV
jgi:ribosomal protein S6